MEMFIKYKKELITGTSLALLLFLFLKYLFPLLSPFLLSYLSVYAVYPFLYKMETRWKLKKSITMTAILVLVGVLFLGALWIISLFSSGSVENALPLILEWKERLLVYFNVEMLNKLLPEVIRNSFSYLQKAFPVFAYVGIYLIATILMAKDFDALMTKVHSIGALDVVMNAVNEIVHTAGKYMKAQGILIVLITGTSILGLSIAAVPSPVFLGILTGLMDALPFIGTSIVLLPIALLYFIEREILKACIIVAVYLLCVGIREFMEPRLVGKELDIFPVIMLISIFAGMKMFGVSGILKGPLFIVLYKKLWNLLFIKMYD